MIKPDNIYSEMVQEINIASEIVTILPTKSNIEKVANGIITEVKEGRIDGFELLARMEAIKSMCEMVRAGVEHEVRENLEKYGREGHLSLDAKFELAEVGVKYDYSKCPIWSQMKKDYDALNETMKSREKFLKALSKPMNEIDVGTGEVFEVIPPTKTSKSSFRITLSK